MLLTVPPSFESYVGNVFIGDIIGDKEKFVAKIISVNLFTNIFLFLTISLRHAAHAHRHVCSEVNEPAAETRTSHAKTSVVRLIPFRPRMPQSFPQENNGDETNFVNDFTIRDSARVSRSIASALGLKSRAVFEGNLLFSGNRHLLPCCQEATRHPVQVQQRRLGGL